MVSTYMHEPEVSENDGQLLFHWSCLDQKMTSFASTEATWTKSQWKQWPALLPFATTGGARKPPVPKQWPASLPSATTAWTATMSGARKLPGSIFWSRCLACTTRCGGCKCNWPLLTLTFVLFSSPLIAFQTLRVYPESWFFLWNVWKTLKMKAVGS